MTDVACRLRLRQKLTLLLLVWARYLLVKLRLQRYPVAVVVKHLSQRSNLRPHAVGATRLGQVVYRSLRVAQHQPRCLTTALVLYSLLREHGEEAQLVIGLPEQATDQFAHAWVEVNGVDVGPPPGRGTHVELVRYG